MKWLHYMSGHCQCALAMKLFGIETIIRYWNNMSQIVNSLITWRSVWDFNLNIYSYSNNYHQIVRFIFVPFLEHYNYSSKHLSFMFLKMFHQDRESISRVFFIQITNSGDTSWDSLLVSAVQCCGRIFPVVCVCKYQPQIYNMLR